MIIIKLEPSVNKKSHISPTFWQLRESWPLKTIRNLWLNFTIAYKREKKDKKKQVMLEDKVVGLTGAWL